MAILAGAKWFGTLVLVSGLVVLTAGVAVILYLAFRVSPMTAFRPLIERSLSAYRLRLVSLAPAESPGEKIAGAMVGVADELLDGGIGAITSKSSLDHRQVVNRFNVVVCDREDGVHRLVVQVLDDGGLHWHPALKNIRSKSQMDALCDELAALAGHDGRVRDDDDVSE